MGRVDDGVVVGQRGAQPGDAAEAADPDLADRQPRAGHAAGERRRDVDAGVDQVRRRARAPRRCRRAAAPSRRPSGRQDRQAGGRSVAGERQQRVDVEVLLDEVAEQVEPARTGRGEGRRPTGGRPSASAEERAPKLVTLQAAVPHRPEDRARRAPRRGTPRRARATDPTVVDLVARGRRAQRRTGRQAQHLLGRERSCARRAGRALGTGRPARPRSRRGRRRAARASGSHRRCRGPAARVAAWSTIARSSPRERSHAEVADRRAGARQHDQVGVGEVARVGGEDDVEVGLEAERVDVGEVADPGEPHDRDAEAGRRSPPRRPSRSSASSESSQSFGSHGSTPKTAPPGQGLERARARGRAAESRRGTCSPRSRRSAPGPPATAARCVPNIAANTPPRSMSPTTTVGIEACRASPMFT